MRMYNAIFSLIVGLCLVCTTTFGQRPVSQNMTLKLMGCSFTIKVIAKDNATAWQAINAGVGEIDRIEKLISSWDPSSQTSEINRQAGKQAVTVDEELLNLISRAIKISELTHGAFDISYASMDRIYKFDQSEQELPSETEIAQSKSRVDFKKIILDREASTVFLKEEGMKIGFGGIGKGYAAEQAKKKIQAVEGVSGGIVNASGDLAIWGDESNDQNIWNIKIADPKDPAKYLVEIPASNTAVVTSGDYEKYFTNEGVRYGHIINPNTGLPTRGIKSVTIICNDAELSDALATSVTILGVDEGLYLVNQLHGVEALLVTDDDELLYSENIKLNYN